MRLKALLISHGGCGSDEIERKQMGLKRNKQMGLEYENATNPCGREHALCCQLRHS
jgi:hypothetical protein